MSASALRESAAENGGFPDKVTFLLQFVPGLALNTMRSWLICPELPHILSSSASGGDRSEVTDALYVNGRRRWGLEVHWDEDIDGSTSKLAPGGEYGVVPVDDYAMINFRGSKGGVIPKESLQEKRRSRCFSSWGFFKMPVHFWDGNSV